MALKHDNIYNMDCIKGMAKLQAGSVDLAFADPPFNIGYDYDIYDDRKAANDYLKWSRAWIEGVIRVLKANGTFWLAIGDEYAAELKVLCTRELGLHCRSWVIWFYTFGVNCKQKFTRSHAHLFHFVKDAKSFTFNVNDIRVPSARQLVYGDKRAVQGGRLPDDTWMAPADLPPETPMFDGFVLRPQDIPDRFPSHSDTWYFSRVAGTFGERRGWHGCQMPEQLLGRIIRACSNEGDVVLDPFGGSGTTLAVAKKLNRKFIGFELSDTYVEKINIRLNDAHPGAPLIGPENPERSSPSTSIGRRLKETRSQPEFRELPDQCRSVTTSAVVTRVNATLGQIAVVNREFNTAIAEAFIASHQGFSADRVIADPTLNEQFAANCGRLAIPGNVKTWNRLLLQLRKMGALKAIDTSRRTCASRASMGDYLFASEIAWKCLADRGCSLDDILCDPELSSEFDAFCKRIAPGFTSFEYRWAALAVRKDFSISETAVPDARSAVLRVRATAIRSGTLPLSPGQFLLSAGPSDHIFTGFAPSLRHARILQPDSLERVVQVLNLKIGNLEEIVIRAKSGKVLMKPVGTIENGQACRRAQVIRDCAPVGNVLLRAS